MAKYNKNQKQQYALKRKKVLKKVESKLKKAGKKPKAKAKPKVKARTKPEAEVLPLPRGVRGSNPAKLHYKHGKLKLTANVRYHAEKIEPIVKTVLMADGVEVKQKLKGYTRGKEVYVDNKGKEHDKSKVKCMQVLPDGSLKPIEIEKTEDIIVEPVDKKVMDEFHGEKWVEVYGETPEDDPTLREMAWDLMQSGQIGAIKKFAHRIGGRHYFAFIKSVASKDGEKFVLEMMLARSKKKRRYWMPVETEEKEEASEVEVPELW